MALLSNLCFTPGEVKLFMEANGWGFPGIEQTDAQWWCFVRLSSSSERCGGDGMSISYDVYSGTKMRPTLVREKMSQEFEWVVGPDSLLMAPGLVMWFDEMPTGFLKETALDDYGVDSSLLIVFQVDRRDGMLGYLNMVRAVWSVLSMDAADLVFMMEEVPLLLRQGGRLSRFKQSFWSEDLIAILPPHEIQENPVSDDL